MCSLSKNILTLFLLAYETEIRRGVGGSVLSDVLLQVSWSWPLLLVLISERMGLAGLSEVINIRGHRVILIEWPPHCDAWEEPLLRHILQPDTPLSNLTPPPPPKLLMRVPWRRSIGAGFSHRQAQRKQALFEVDGKAADRV